MNKYLIISLILTLGLITTSCKTKKILPEDKNLQQVRERVSENEELMGEAGLDGDLSAQLVAELEKIDLELMHFLATDPDNDAKRLKFKDLMDRRKQLLMDGMTAEEYASYRKAVVEKSRKKSKEVGGPLIKPGG